jgi:NAD(P)-dependent dehydrogenase (short-subunit alcohol dehydrogenase family)
MPSEFQDLHVVVTGATGELGAAVARLLAERGAICHLPCRSTSKLAAFGGLAERMHPVAGIELGDEAAVAGFYAGLPPISASLHCAGAFVFAPIESSSLADLQKLLAANALASFLCAREAVRAFRRAGAGGRIVNVAARQALEPRRGARMVAYTMTKSAVVALTLALAEEVVGEGILVNAVAPSVMDTPANRAAMPKEDASRWPSLEDVAREMAALASPANRTIQGAIVPVYGRA